MIYYQWPTLSNSMIVKGAQMWINRVFRNLTLSSFGTIQIWFSNLSPCLLIWQGQHWLNICPFLKFSSVMSLIFVDQMTLFEMAKKLSRHLDDTGETRRTISWQSVCISWCFYYKGMMLILWWLWLMQRTPHAVMVNRHSCRLNNCSICLPASTTHTISHKITVYVITIRWCLLAGILVYVGPNNIYFFMHDAIAS